MRWPGVPRASFSNLWPTGSLMQSAAGRANCMAGDIEVEIVCALPDRQYLMRVCVPEGCTVRRAIALSGIADSVPEVDVLRAPVGIFGQVVDDAESQELCHGDRVEIYRELTQDPRTARRRRVR